MKEEYRELIISYFIMLGVLSVIFLIADLFVDGAFFLGMLNSLIVWTIIYLVGFIALMLKTNYKIIKREE